MFTKYQVIFFWLNLHAEPRKLASIVKPKTCHAQGIAVDFVGDHLKVKKVTEFNKLDKLLSKLTEGSKH